MGLIITNTQAIEESGIICLGSNDKSGQKEHPKLYYFESNKVQEFVLRKIIRAGAVLASEKEIVLKKSKKFKFRTPRPNYIYWQENNETMIYNTKTNSLKVKILDEKVRTLECYRSLSKTEFYSKMMKWKKLYNMRLNARP